ncbi:hypothetical protein PgNI_05657 [Pyricularia grisea]|uniref:Uncharacterized protein n=1 Tax=Pyricularia grisea TaxID=148305 RepID=A0A6P8B4T4_PYRGI|nr:hypothetical protein PgNI_05657 [Pyricularia grisea]TLD10139.1 hypothetical protein PgNI_05657 [Pyricularia grisea]
MAIYRHFATPNVASKIKSLILANTALRLCPSTTEKARFRAVRDVEETSLEEKPRPGWGVAHTTSGRAAKDGFQWDKRDGQAA